MSCAHWLNFKVGLNIGAARENVRVAHALPGVPKIAAAMARGELSYSKVRALTRGLKARLPALAGAVLVKAVEAALDAVPSTTVSLDEPPDRRSSFQERRADALALIRVAQASAGRRRVLVRRPPGVGHLDRPRNGLLSLDRRTHGLRTRRVGAVLAGRSGEA
jgi:hypothetical protein